MEISIARIYENKTTGNEIRILVDRLWPRGISKDDAKLDYWHKEWAPGNELRKEFHQNKISWNEFRKKYQEELESKKQEILEDLQELDKRKALLLLYGARDKEQNHAILLQEFLENL